MNWLVLVLFCDALCRGKSDSIRALCDIQHLPTKTPYPSGDALHAGAARMSSSRCESAPADKKTTWPRNQQVKTEARNRRTQITMSRSHGHAHLRVRIAIANV